MKDASMDKSTVTEKQSNKKIAVGTALGYVALAVSVLSGLFFTPWIKQNVGNAMYGIYTLAQSVVNLFLLDFGLSNAINAFVSKYRAENRISDERRFLSASLKIYLFLDIVLLIIFVLVYFLIEYIYVGLTNDEIVILKNVFIILTGFSLLTFPSSLFTGILKAYEEFGWIKAVEIVNKLVYIALTAISLLLNLGIYAVIFSYSFSSFVNALCLFIFCRFKLKKKILFREKTNWDDIKQIISFSSYAFINSVSSRLIFTLAPSILGIVSDSTNIAVFGVCSSLEGYVYSFSSVMSGFFMPKIVRIGSRSNNDASSAKNMNSLAIKVGKIQAALVLLIIIGFIAVGQDFIEVWMQGDHNYDPAYFGVLLLVTYQTIFSAETIFMTAMYSDKATIKPFSIAALICSALNVVLLFAFGYLFGSFGACLAIFVTHCLELIIWNVQYRKYLHVSLKTFFKKVYIGFLPATALSVTIAILFSVFLPFSPIFNILIGGIGTVVSFLSLVWLGFGLDETKRFFSNIKLFFAKNK